MSNSKFLSPKIFDFFSGFSDFDWWFFHFLSYRARRWLKKSFIDHISICNHNLGDFWPHRRYFRGGVKLTPPSRMGRFRTPKPDRVKTHTLLFPIENFSDFSGKMFLKNEIKAKMWHIRFRVFFVLYSNFFLKTAHTFY